MTKQRLGFVGLGNMGYHMASNLVESGYPLAIYDIRKDIMDSFSGNDVIKTNSPLEVANEADIVLVSLPTPKVVKEVVLGDNGLIYGNRMHTYIDLSTSGQDVSSTVGNELMKKGVKVLDSPVSGGVHRALDGTLTLMVSGDEQVFNECSKILKKIGEKVFLVGNEIGQAQVMKVINNLLSSAALAITSEAIVLGTKAGLDPSVMIDILNVSSGKNSATEDKFKKSILNRKFDYGFSTALAYKDMKLCMELADKLQVPMFLGNNIVNFWKFALDQNGEEADYTEIIKQIENWAGVKVESSPSLQLNV